jgi:NAD(P)-dependent dehydrogenase (short-subunit alcohol dehydrogenase family)
MNSLEQKAVELLSLKGKVAVITGGASGIGRGTAVRLAEMGADIALLDIQEKKAKKVAHEIETLGVRAKFFYCDVRSSVGCKKTAEAVFQEYGRVDILFNNAGGAIRKDTVELSEEEWDITLDVTLKGIFMLFHFIIPLMIKNGGGSIINTGSEWSLKGGPRAVAYCAAKGGAINLTRAMAIDHGKDNIRVNCVCPGDVDTPMLKGECSQLGEDIDSFMKNAADRPIARVGVPEDIANAVLFLASDMSKWVTGAHLVVDGGGSAT